MKKCSGEYSILYIDMTRNRESVNLPILHSNNQYFFKSNRSRFITLSHAAIKSLTNFSLASALA